MQYYKMKCSALVNYFKATDFVNAKIKQVAMNNKTAKSVILPENNSKISIPI